MNTSSHTLTRRLLALGFIIALVSPAAASDGCIQLARKILTADPAFPQIVETTAQQLPDWPQSCAATPPTGEGRLVAVCRAETGDAPIYFWLRQSSASQTLGFLPCPG